MIAVILLLHRVRLVDQILDSEYCSVAVTRNEGRSIITHFIKRILQVLPSSHSFSPRNVIAGWELLGLQPIIHVGAYEDAQEVLATLLVQLLLKVPRSNADKIFTKFQGQLICRKTRDCQAVELADDFVGQSDISPCMHVVGIQNDGSNPVRIKEKLQQFCSSNFESRCKSIMCKKKVRGATIQISPCRFTIIGINRNNNQGKVMNKLDLSPHSEEINSITKEPVAVISHGGSVQSGHYIVYTKVGDIWYVNNDNQKVTATNSPFDQSNIAGETADIIVFQN